MVFPDTSPRGVDIPGSKDVWYFGEGAGYYVDATTDKYKKNYNMYTYCTKELPELVSKYFHIDSNRQSITGFSMGGLGALMIALKNPEKYKSISAFSPIANPSKSKDWSAGFKGFLGSIEAGKEYDPTLIMKSYTGPKIPLKID